MTDPTITALVQDDDAVEFMVATRAIADTHADVLTPRETDQLYRMSSYFNSHLSPTPDTGLIEAATKLVKSAHYLPAHISDNTSVLRRDFEALRTALANAAPAQVESTE